MAGAHAVKRDGVTSGSSSGPWLTQLMEWELPTPSAITIEGQGYDMYWPSQLVLAVPGGAPANLVASCTARGIDVLDLPADPPAEIPANLAQYFGK